MFGNPDYAGKPVQWGGQSFQDPAALSRWLRARGASPAIWAIRHPAAAQALGMAMPNAIPATPDVQGPPGFQGAPPPMPAMHPQVPPDLVPQHPQGPGAPSDLLAAILGGIAGQAGSGLEPSGRVPSEGGHPHPVTVPGRPPPWEPNPHFGPPTPAEERIYRGFADALRHRPRRRYGGR